MCAFFFIHTFCLILQSHSVAIKACKTETLHGACKRSSLLCLHTPDFAGRGSSPVTCPEVSAESMWQVLCNVRMVGCDRGSDWEMIHTSTLYPFGIVSLLLYIAAAWRGTSMYWHICTPPSGAALPRAVGSSHVSLSCNSTGMHGVCSLLLHLFFIICHPYIPFI